MALEGRRLAPPKLPVLRRTGGASSVTAYLAALALFHGIHVTAALAGDLTYYEPAPSVGRGRAVKLLSHKGADIPVKPDPIAILREEEVEGVHGEIRFALDVEDQPVKALYSIVLELNATAQARMQSVVDARCKERPSLLIVMDDHIVGDLNVHGCGRFRAIFTFDDRAQADAFGHRFATDPILYSPPTPRGPEPSFPKS